MFISIAILGNCKRRGKDLNMARTGREKAVDSVPHSLVVNRADRSEQQNYQRLQIINGEMEHNPSAKSKPGIHADKTHRGK
jgi:hypothetical protein